MNVSMTVCMIPGPISPSSAVNTTSPGKAQHAVIGKGGRPVDQVVLPELCDGAFEDLPPRSLRQIARGLGPPRLLRPLHRRALVHIVSAHRVTSCRGIGIPERASAETATGARVAVGKSRNERFAVWRGGDGACQRRIWRRLRRCS